MIEFHEVTFAYANARPVFDRFNWSIGRGEAWAVIGGSGNGKTTLLMLLAGLRVPTSGEIVVEDQVDRSAAAAHGIGPARIRPAAVGDDQSRMWRWACACATSTGPMGGTRPWSTWSARSSRWSRSG